MRLGRRALALAFVATLATLGGGCARYVGHAKRAYVQGRYLEAAENLAVHEPDLYDLSPRKQADYGIYRGLALMQLGDYGGAHRWLSFAHHVEQREPGTLTSEQRTVLDGGFWELGRRMATLRQVPPNGPAPAAKQPTDSPEPPPTEL